MDRQPFVDQEACISCQFCVDTVPEVFRMNQNNSAEAYNPFGASKLKIMEAIEGCPVSCIHWN
jgi:ferredoxin